MVAPLVSLDAALLRSALGVLVLRPGQVVTGRVLERHGAHGLLLLGGRALVAELPANVEAGTRLRLAVAGSDGERVLLHALGEQQQQPAAVPPPPPPDLRLPLPDGREVDVRVAERSASGAGTDRAAAVSLRVETPALGAIDLRIELGPGGVRATVAAAPGAPLAAAQAAAQDLRAALADAAGAPAAVSVQPRHDPVDVRA
jgi:hypothetical protein